MAQTSAGILLYKTDPGLQVFLVHPGGPYWTNKDEGAWSIPKGVIQEEEEQLSAAIREFEEEIGFSPQGDFIKLGSIKQKGSKTVYAWAVEGDLPKGFFLDSNTFEIEWPPNTGNRQEFPEIDRAEFFPEQEARKKINAAQAEFIDRLLERVN